MVILLAALAVMYAISAADVTTTIIGLRRGAIETSHFYGAHPSTLKLVAGASLEMAAVTLVAWGIGHDAAALPYVAMLPAFDALGHAVAVWNNLEVLRSK